MFVIGNLLNALATVIDIVLQTLLAVILVNALLSWVRPDPHNPIVQFLERVSDLVCNPIRRFLPAMAGLDFSPFLAMLAIWFIKEFLVGTLRDMAIRMG